jgi:predicted TIM-barrel fold metal-dependent hydrolase
MITTGDDGLAGVVDCGVLHSWRTPLDVFEYLSEGWREYVLAHMLPAWRDYARGVGEKPAGKLTSTPLTPDLAYYNPLGDYLPGSLPPDAFAAGCDPELLRQQHLDPSRIGRALLCHGPGALVPVHGVTRLSVELSRAVNDYTIDRWLTADDRLYGTVLVPTQVPEAAAAEIRRVGGHARMAAVLLCANGLAKPFGHPVYAPIFEAAHELELPIVIQAGGDQTVETASYPAAAGVPGTFTEFRVLAPQPLMTHAASLIGQGVMYRYPSLRFLLLGGSVGWITPFLWRFDTDFKAFRHDLLWLKHFPSEVFREFFFVGTSPFNFSAANGSLGRYLAADHELGEVICYASGYPDSEYADPPAVASALPVEWRSKVLHENAMRFLGSRAGAAQTAETVTTSTGRGE